MPLSTLRSICRLIRKDILTSTSKAGSGHPTSSLSAVELMTALFFGGYFKSDLQNPEYIFNDRIIFSKGHASPLLYATYHLAGAISEEELLTLRSFGSRLEGHPTPRFPYVDVATGSLGHGVSIGIGMALGINLIIQKEKLKIRRKPKVWVLLGDSEMAEGQLWEALETASYYNLNNLVGILDVNRLGQESETMLSWDILSYQKRISSFGWDTVLLEDGHNLKQIIEAFQVVDSPRTTHEQKPIMIIARTVKGKGVSFLEDKPGWHGKALNKEQLTQALKELGKIDKDIKGIVTKPEKLDVDMNNTLSTGGSDTSDLPTYNPSDSIATREAYGDALVNLGKKNKRILVLDAEVANSSYENKFQGLFFDRFFELFIAEENMADVALGMSSVGFIPYFSTFAAFLTQIFDQVRMAQYSEKPRPSILTRLEKYMNKPPGRQSNPVLSEESFSPALHITGSHAGVAIGQDGPSQMGLEDIAMFRSILKSIVLYPGDAVSAFKLTQLVSNIHNITYIRTTRNKTPVLYHNAEQFHIGGSKMHLLRNRKNKPKVLVIAAGVTLHEALKAQKQLDQQGTAVAVMDCYSIKPLDSTTLLTYARQVRQIIVAEDHYVYGGIGEAVLTELSRCNTFSFADCVFTHLCVNKIPRSGTPEELLAYENIDAAAIARAVRIR